MPHVFDRFYKSERIARRGLGLAIAKSLVVAHGGEISVASEPGQGAEMRFTIPVRRRARARRLVPFGVQSARCSLPE